MSDAPILSAAIDELQKIKKLADKSIEQLSEAQLHATIDPEANSVAILKAYQRLISSEIARREARIEHAGPANEAMLAGIAASMTRRSPAPGTSPNMRRMDEVAARSAGVTGTSRGARMRRAFRVVASGAGTRAMRKAARKNATGSIYQRC